jgi:uncharacterized membrane protein YgcG
MDAPRTWQAVSVATAAVALGVGAALLRTPASVPAPPIELAVVEPFERDPSLSAGDRITAPVITAADPRIVLPSLREGAPRVSAASAPTPASTASPDEASTSSGSTSRSTTSSGSTSTGSTSSGGTSSGGTSSGGTSSSGSATTSGSTSSGTTRPAQSADSPDSADSSTSVASPSSTDSD